MLRRLFCGSESVMSEKVLPKQSGSGKVRTMLVFLMPLVYRPEEAGFAAGFHHLSAECGGYIFAAGAVTRHTIGSFVFYGSKFRHGILARFFSRLWAQVLFPVLVLRGQPKPDAIVTYDPYASGLAGILLKWAWGSRLVVQINGDYHETEPSDAGLKKWVMQWIMDFSLRKADAVKVLNDSQEWYIRRTYPVTRVFNFPNLIASDYFKRLSTFQGDYFLSIGYPFKLKGMDIVIKAFVQVAEQHPTIKLRIMGYCPENELNYYRDLAHKNPCVEFIKPAWIAEVGEQLRGCYALVHASRSEAMGRVLLEAMACKKPIITTRTNGGKTCVEDSVTGLHCAINDVQELAEKMEVLLSDPARARSMGQAGFDRLDRLFSPPQYLSSFMGMLRTLNQSAIS